MSFSHFASKQQAGEAARQGRHSPPPSRFALLCCTALSFMLVGCDQLGIETPQKTAERQQAEARAVGSACRHALRAIEDCYTLNPKADKSSVFAGWREMDEYMRENKLEGVAPVVPRPAPQAASAASSPPSDAEEEEEEEVVEEEPPKGKRGKATKGQ